MQTQKRPFEIIIGSNGSYDQTAALGFSLAAAYPQVIFFHDRQKGVGGAFRKAVQKARYEHIVSIDMDLSTDLEYIERALSLLENGYSIVVGSKKIGFQQRSSLRILGSGLFILFARLLLNLPFEDYSIAAKAYNKDLILKYLSKVERGTSYVIEIICHAHRNHAKIIEVPVKCRDLRASRFNIIHEGLYRFSNLFKLWWRLKRQTIF